MVKINADTAQLFSQFKSNELKLSRTIEQLSSGIRVGRPGDSVKDMERGAILDFQRSSEFAQMQAIQSRLTWYQVELEHLKEIRSIATSMSELAIRANSGTAGAEDLDILDTTFQGYKERLSLLIDGNGGSKLPLASFGDIPFFLDYSPGTVIGPDDTPEGVGVKSVNLYTGYEHAGFSDLPLLSTADLNSSRIPQVTPKLIGTATAGSTTTLTLDEVAINLDDAYTGMTITITSGTGSGQTATIANYDALTRIATFQTAVGTALDNTSVYSIDSGKPNYSIRSLGGVTAPRFAEHVWGADSYRLDHLNDDITLFQAFTDEETAFRTANGIANTDLDPRTPEEKNYRRERNIFDPVYGNLSTKKTAGVMLLQLERAVDQLSIEMAREASKAETLQKNYEQMAKVRDEYTAGIQYATEVDIASKSVSYNDLEVAHGLIFEIAKRMSENFSKLTNLANRG